MKLDLTLHFAYFRKRTLEGDKLRRMGSLDMVSACMYRVPECLPHLNWNSTKTIPEERTAELKVHPFLHAEKLTGKKRAKPTNLPATVSRQPGRVWIHEKSLISEVVCGDSVI